MTTSIEQRPRVCEYSVPGNRHICTEATGAFAVRSRTGGVGAACGPCYAAKHGKDAPHGHTQRPDGSACPVCGEAVTA